jgi:hypothetical protein
VVVIVPDVTWVSPGEVNRIVLAPTVPLIARLVNVASPDASVLTVNVPSSVPPPVAITAVTGIPLCETGLLLTSRSWITGCCANAAPFTAVVDGWVVMESVSRRASRQGDG